ncbi:protein PAXX isoform X2 [Pungitius pungitius]|uniref:protein PAXX isoform X2 n=1 Tax=Pungitius pungitius TaxID=134920 RepID=UPI002E122F6D
MEACRTEYCTLWDQKNQSKFLCYSRTQNGLSNICLTDAADVWSTEHTEDTLDQFRQTFALRSTEDYILKLRAACARGEVSVVVHSDSAAVHVRSGSGDQSLTLSRLEGPRATQEVKEQLFSMADRLTQPEILLDGSASVSPVKSHRRHPAEFKPHQQTWTSSKTMKKRLPGASLINPGAKRSNMSNRLYSLLLCVVPSD